MPGAAGTKVGVRDPKTMTSPVAIDATLCKACGICVGLCPRDVLAAGPDGVAKVMQPDECTACRICELECPDLAITVRLPAKHRATRAKAETG